MTDLTKELEKPLDRSLIKEREGAGGNVYKYIEGENAIHNANRLFTFFGWDRDVENTQVLFEVIDKQWHAIYTAKCTITVRVGDEVVSRVGHGFGDGKNYKPSGAIELAIKEAETDAMKRALVTFGNQFGLELYDKSIRKQIDNEKREEEGLKKKAAKLDSIISELTEKLKDVVTQPDLDALRKKQKEWLEKQPKDAQVRISQVYEERAQELVNSILNGSPQSQQVAMQ